MTDLNLYKKIRHLLKTKFQFDELKMGDETISIIIGKSTIIINGASIENAAKMIYVSNNILMFNDYSFKSVINYFTNKKEKIQCNSYIIDFLNAFRIGGKKNKFELYNSLFLQELKKEFNKRNDFNELLPENEFFLFTDDQLSFRYKKKKKVFNRSKIKVLDENAYIFIKDGQMSIDMQPSFGSVIKNGYCYYGLKTKLKRIKQNKGSHTHSVGNQWPMTVKNRDFVQEVVDLKSIDPHKRIKIKKCYLNDFYLYFEGLGRNKIYYLKDLAGNKISINHCDLLCAFVD